MLKTEVEEYSQEADGTFYSPLEHQKKKSIIRSIKQ